MKIKMSYTGRNSAANSKIFGVHEFDFSDMHQLTKDHNYSNIIWKDGVRNADNFLEAHSLILDVDGTLSLEDAKTEFQSTRHVCIVTSKSHQHSSKIDELGRPGKPITPGDFYHVIIGLEEPITQLTTYQTVMTNLIASYGSDPSCKDGGRFYFGNPHQQFWYS